jgi:hypothetical protein
MGQLLELEMLVVSMDEQLDLERAEPMVALKE